MYHGIYCRLNLHVAATRREVIAAALKRLKPSARASGKGGRRMRPARHELLRAVLAEHEEARAPCIAPIASADTENPTHLIAYMPTPSGAGV